MKPTLLLLHSDEAASHRLAQSLAHAEYDVLVAEGVNDCIRKVARNEAHLLVVHDSLTAPSAIEFLAKAREKAPALRRALLCDDPSRYDLNEIINLAGVVALWPSSVDGETVVKLFHEIRRMTPALAPSDDAEALRTRIADLEQKLRKTERDLRVARSADTTLRQDELQLSTLKMKEAADKLGINLDIDYLSDDLEGEVIKALEAMLEAPGVDLPVLPQVALELQKLMKDPDVSFDKVADLIKTEASLSARVLSICNSPVYGSSEKISNVNQAVTRLGVAVMRDLVQTAAMEGLFKTEFKGMEDLMVKLWLHSLATAHANLAVSRELALEDSEDFFAHGLLHDIGKFLIAGLIQQGFDLGLWNGRIITPKLTASILQKRHTDMGARLLSKWQYPKSFIDVIAYHNDDQNICRYHESVVVTYYSNALTRKLGYSLVKHDADILSSHDLAQALNLTPAVGTKIEAAMVLIIDKIKKSYFQS